MRKIILIVLISFLALFTPLLRVKSVYAASGNVQDCTLTLDGPVKWADKNSNTFYYNSSLKSGDITFKFTFNDPTWNNSLNNSKYLTQPDPFVFEVWRSLWAYPDKVSDNISVVKDANYVKYTTYHDTDNKVVIFDRSEAYTVKLWGKNTEELLCEGTYKVIPSFNCDIKVQADRTDQTFLSNWTAIVSNINISSNWEANRTLDFQTSKGFIPATTCDDAGMCSPVTFTQPNGSMSFNLGQFEKGDQTVQAVTSPNKLSICGPYQFHVYPLDDAICEQSPCKTPRGDGREDNYNCTDSVCQSCSYCRLHPTTTLTPIPRPTDNPILCRDCQVDHDCSGLCGTCSFCNPPTPIPSPTNFPPPPPLAPLCEQLPIEFEGKCKNCIDRDHGIWTAVGCIPINPEVFIRDYIFKIGVGIAGGVAFLYFIFGVFQILTSAGNAEKIAQAKEIIMSAISGLLLIIFSILLLKVIGVDILRIPGFG